MTAVVVRLPGSEPTREEIIALCCVVLAGYQTPKDVLFIDGQLQ